MPVGSKFPNAYVTNLMEVKKELKSFPTYVEFLISKNGFDDVFSEFMFSG